ncbi:hypothetical protein IP90_00772 [Luteimonas cucumeris]|jgi:hypothetical protein|uniref:Nuclear transport factor 2 family protein n=1 Tax=Luteimonas cucumeris TaxID=985012 RepID=A0A562LAE1_9GAMM|nr:hypothetical protein [Luteimonas cucumeris]TWI04639.1 hypothetical protein IP90_00772 [Luteimonas cucumeris]
MKAATIRSKVEIFFKRYTATYARAMADKPGVDKAVSDAFADYFVESGPGGVHGGKNGLVFRFMARRGFSRYRRIGVQSMEISRLEVTPLQDGQHAMAQVTWDSRTVRKADGRLVRIVFDHTYFLTLVGGKPRIFAYVATDEEAILRRHRLI